MSYTWTEIANQSTSWSQTLALMDAQSDALITKLSITEETHFLFIGCGTSFYLAQSAARLFQQATGRISTAIPASEVFLADSSVMPPHTGNTVAFAISRSGTTTEVILALQHLKEVYPDIRTIAVTCHPEGETAKLAAHAIVLEHAYSRKRMK